MDLKLEYLMVELLVVLLANRSGLKQVALMVVMWDM